MKPFSIDTGGHIFNAFSGFIEIAAGFDKPGSRDGGAAELNKCLVSNYVSDYINIQAFEEDARRNQCLKDLNFANILYYDNVDDLMQNSPLYDIHASPGTVRSSAQ